MYISEATAQKVERAIVTALLGVCTTEIGETNGEGACAALFSIAKTFGMTGSEISRGVEALYGSPVLALNDDFTPVEQEEDDRPDACRKCESTTCKDSPLYIKS